MMLTQLSLGLSLRMLNCVAFCQSREQRYIVVIYGILIMTFSYMYNGSLSLTTLLSYS